MQTTYPRMFSLKTFCCFLLFFVSAPFLKADWPPISREEMDIKSVPNQPDAPAMILYHEEIDDDTLHVHQFHMRIKILTEKGREYADVKLPFDKRDFNITDVKGRTTHADGTVVNFEGKAMDKEIVKGKNVKYHVKAFTLPDVQPGSVIEYSYALRYDDHSLLSPAWILQRDLYQRKQYFKFTPYPGDIQLPHDVVANGLAWVMYLPPKIDIKSTRDKYYELTLNDIPAFVEEDYMPPATGLKYHVAFYYRYSPSPESFWKDEAKYFNKDQEKFINRDGGVSDAVNKLVSASDSPEEKAKKIYAFVQTLRNNTYSPERSTEENKQNGFVWNKGNDDVLRQKAGNRDDLTRLFVGMARKAGIQAYVMEVPDRSETLFEKAFLTTEQFDALVAIININGKDLFVDPGTRFCPYGAVRWNYTGAQGVRQTAKGADLGQVDFPEFGKDAVQRAGNFILTSEGLVKGHLLVRYYGQEALTRRLEGAQTDPAGRKKMFEDECKGWLPSNAEVKLSKDPVWDEYEKPLTVEFDISAPILTSAGKRTLLATNFLAANQQPFFTHANREHYVYFHFPTRFVDEIHIALPAGYEVESVPGEANVNVGYGAYKYTQTHTQRELVANRDLEMGQLTFRAQDYPALKSFYDKVKEGDDQQVVLRSAGHVQGN